MRNIRGTSIHYLLILLLLTSCATMPFSRLGECRHQAMECALIFGEKVGNAQIGIASGPFNKTEVWHAQTYLMEPGHADLMKPWKWLKNKGYSCEIGGQENFVPHKYMDVEDFFTWQFSWVD